MKEYTLPHFGKLSTDNLEEYYDVYIDVNGNRIQIDLNFENGSIDALKLDKVKNYLDNIEKFDRFNKQYILEDYHDENGDTVKFYLEHHLEEFEKDHFSSLINFHDTTIKPEQQLLTKLKLLRIGLYPDSEENFAVSDYSIGEDFTNYLVVVNTDENGQLDYMAMES
ncbi:DUF2004 domain-containing protein [Chryseobacterium sp.]|uniref:DUF2004 domain-containing protein n=1 Tax=Chryseobacterium sp. TaxID=1871047 RepID=UPI0025B9441F|nr:DUF2004 domain-containing protein [Chryseobacterium sp.]MBV8328017.1 DUF2004 domain-containing protein [Chryseobacterium sp.]